MEKAANPRRWTWSDWCMKRISALIALWQWPGGPQDGRVHRRSDDTPLVGSSCCQLGQNSSMFKGSIDRAACAMATFWGGKSEDQAGPAAKVAPHTERRTDRSRPWTHLGGVDCFAPLYGRRIGRHRFRTHGARWQAHPCTQRCGLAGFSERGSLSRAWNWNGAWLLTIPPHRERGD